jgi:hypothetical protein
LAKRVSSPVPCLQKRWPPFRGENIKLGERPNPRKDIASNQREEEINDLLDYALT